MATSSSLASTGTPVCLSQPSVPVFNGQEYGRWNLRMNTVFRSQELWDLVENGWTETKDEAMERENRNRDAKALSLIQQAVDGPNLDRIAEAKTAHEAWEVLRKHSLGTSKVLSVRIQALRQDFETLQMGDDEGVQGYISRVITITNQIKALGHKLKEPEVVSKVLRSLAPKFDWVTVAIEESKEIAKLTLDDLCGTLQAYEVRVNHAAGKVGERALHTKIEQPGANVNKNGGFGSSWGEGRGRGRCFARGRGRGHSGRGRGMDNKSHIQCFQCKKFGHMKAECRARDKQPEKGAGLVAEEGSTENLFMKRLQGVQYVPGLAHNLLSVGQLLSRGYSVMFEKNQCIIRDNHEKERVISVPRTSNNMFPLDVAKMENFVMTVRSQADEEL
ncbi:uncharacterized protein LOC120267191 [Dioscorea cayenensis subsp. rotundata]|uniref:Uncharacterized protein LOC120267191 n=1 Tax=Dioscorea cayennensis subsp. rotundata TaxID=55577 RepID=A0AB40BTQ3_DIOCR|nr:uncharacterized protein LOC120267191 [Dioscorea cayenensis subsp. rotundata]